MFVTQYIKDVFGAIKSLGIGMRRTLWYFVRPKEIITQQYPDNKDTLVLAERFRGEVVMPHDENNEHACTACGICQTNCPNGTITVTSPMTETEDGKKKKILDKHVWDNGMCTFCNLCVITCPSNAIVFTNEFENAVFSKDKLVNQLNKEGSKLRDKKLEVRSQKSEEA